MHVNDCLLYLNGFAPTQCGGSRKLTLEMSPLSLTGYELILGYE